MASLVTISLFIVLFFLPFLLLYLRHKFVWSKYWSSRNIPHLEPVFLLGNIWRGGTFVYFLEIIKKWHLDNKEKKILGFWVFTKPAILITDLSLIKRILITDFNNFRDRGIEVDHHRDPLAAQLFMLNGKKWRNLRVKLTPTFTSGKMKMMFPAILKCGDQLTRYLKPRADSREVVEVKDLLARFTTDVISTCAFGLETNSLENPNCDFRVNGRKVLENTALGAIINVLFTMNPSLLKTFRFRIFRKDVSDFFLNAVRTTIEYREKNNIKRNDFLQLIIQLMRAGRIEDVDRTPLNDLTDDEIARKFSFEDATAQCFVFFVAGFETSSTALTFALYELALNPDIQSRLQREIDEALDEAGEEISFEKLLAMEYLDMVVQETLRKYPPLGILQRKCHSDYHIPELNVTIPTDTNVLFSVTGIHHDPAIHPEPDRFDPERFAPEKRSRMDSCAFLPFGEGPRNCIGNRFGLMQIKVGLVTIFRRYNVEVCKETPIPVRFNVRSVIPTPVAGMHLVFSNRL